MDSKGKTTDSVLSDDVNNNSGARSKQIVKQSIANIITALAAFVILVIVVIELANIRTIGESVQEQTTINQRYLRCILLLPREAFADSTSRVKALDKCAEDSRLSNGEKLGGQ